MPKHLHEIKARLGLTDRTLAEFLGVSEATPRNWDGGNRSTWPEWALIKCGLKTTKEKAE